VSTGPPGHHVAEPAHISPTDGLFSLLNLSDPLLLPHDNDVIGGLYDEALLDQLTLQRAEFANLCSRTQHALSAAAPPAAPGEPGFVPPHLIQAPGNFKPSSGKAVPALRFLPTNLHVQTTQFIPPGGGQARTQHYVTCGAPADHVGGFGKEGGARKLAGRERELRAGLEARRLELLRSIVRSERVCEASKGEKSYELSERAKRAEREQAGKGVAAIRLSSWARSKKKALLLLLLQLFFCGKSG
jgi:hypothetical protein